MPGCRRRKSGATPAPNRRTQRRTRRPREGSRRTPQAASATPSTRPRASSTSAHGGSGERLTSFQALKVGEFIIAPGPGGRWLLAPLVHDERQVDGVVLVVEAEGVHADV